MPPWLAWGLVFLLGGLTGVAEMISRYRDAPLRATTSRPGIVYLAVNALAAVAALALALELGWVKPEVTSPPTTNLPLAWVLATGLAATTILRTSVFNVRVGGQDLSVGPAAVLQTLLTVVDSEVNQARAAQRAAMAAKVMRGVSFQKAYTALPTFCLAMMQNVSTEIQDQLGKDVAGLVTSKAMDDAAKSQALGLALIKVVGEEVLQEAVRSLGASIVEVGKAESAQNAARLMSAVSFEKAHEVLPMVCLAMVQNISEEDQQVLAADVSELAIADMEDSAKSLALGLGLIRLVGPQVLETAVASLADSIRK